jgi:hypothetical protein
VQTSAKATSERDVDICRQKDHKPWSRPSFCGLSTPFKNINNLRLDSTHPFADESEKEDDDLEGTIEAALEKLRVLDSMRDGGAH